MIKKYNISKAEQYEKNGEKKTYWANIGTMTEFVKENGSVSRIIEIPAISLKAHVFEQEEKKTAPTPKVETPANDLLATDDLPF